jgi:hypothetical protein
MHMSDLLCYTMAVAQVQGQMQATMVDTIEHLLQREFSLTKQWQSLTNSYWNTDWDTKPLRTDPDDHQSYVLTCTE